MQSLEMSTHVEAPVRIFSGKWHAKTKQNCDDNTQDENDRAKNECCSIGKFWCGHHGVLFGN
jgi:hypothetical protein